MKKNLLYPGFELLFSAGVVLCLVLPAVVMAQNHKELKVTINNGDTTINGKNIKDMNAGERKDALKDINGAGSRMGRKYVEVNNSNGIDEIHFHTFALKSDSLNGSQRSQTYTIKSADNVAPMVMTMRRRDDNADGEPMTMNFRRQEENGNGEPREMSMSHNIREDFRGPRRNTESFSYANVNKDGISTNVSYEVSDVRRDVIKKITGADQADLMLNDLILTPVFSTGKTNISFSLVDKGSAVIEFKDSDGKILWSEKIGNSLSKSFELPQNGIYYLQIKQNGKVGLRRIVKES